MSCWFRLMWLITEGNSFTALLIWRSIRNSETRNFPYCQALSEYVGF